MKLSRICAKLIFLLATLNVIIFTLLYAIGLWSFQRNFAHYLEQKDLQQFQPIATTLGEAYARTPSWPALLADRKTQNWIAARLAPDFGMAGNPPPPPHRDAPPPRLLILDAQGRLLLGPRHFPANLARIAIVAKGRTVGYLGVIPAPGFAIAAAEQAFSEQQQRTLATVALALLIASGLGAAGIARWIGRPIGELAHGTNSLASGKSGVRIPVHSGDEFGQLARQFNVLAETLDASRKTRQERIADISHELRAPLTVLRGKIEAIEDGIHPASPDNLRSLGEDLKRLTASVEDLHLLALAAPAAFACQSVPVALDPLLTRLIASHRLAIEEAGLACELSLPEGVWIQGDSTRLVQLFGNLLHNSLSYTDSPGQIRIRIEREATNWKLAWEDSAPGVTDAELDRLTERRYRSADASLRRKDGNGLGLAIARSIAEAHGAKLSARHSNLGGLLWQIHFPVSEGRPC
ncbi:ATP-binding protein [Niveibacterium terrae]|uniref:ATP-binding protein n=1 Tax=Niveibacterium terrae TaxID=3373598 RepID=UPI003A933732